MISMGVMDVREDPKELWSQGEGKGTRGSEKRCRGRGGCSGGPGM